MLAGGFTIYRAGFVSVLLAASLSAAPVPKADPELERITKAFGTVSDREGCKLALGEKDALTVTLEKARPPKEAKPGEKDAGLKLSVPTSVSFSHAAQGEFTATARFQLKTDLTERADDPGVSVGLSVEYPSGSMADIGCGFSTGPALEPADGPRRLRVVAGFHSFTHTPGDNNVKGKFVESGTPPPGDVPWHLRVRVAGKKVLLEVSGDGKAWEKYDELAIQEAGKATVKLTVSSSHGAETQVLVDCFEVK